MTDERNDPFDKLLEDANAQEAEKQESEKVTNSLNDFFEVAMVAYELPRLVDASGNELPDEMSLKVEEYKAYYRSLDDERLHYQSEEEFEHAINAAAEAAVRTQAMAQAALLARAKIVAISYEYHVSHDPLYNESAFESKKKFIALIVAGEGLDASEPWVTFLNQTIPGPALNFESQEDAHYLLEAFEDHARQVEIKENNANLLKKLWEVMGIDHDGSKGATYVGEELEDTTKLIRIAGKIMAVAMLQSNEVERAQMIDEIIRETNLDQPTINTVIEFINENYPLS